MRRDKHQVRMPEREPFKDDDPIHVKLFLVWLCPVVAQVMPIDPGIPTPQPMFETCTSPSRRQSRGYIKWEFESGDPVRIVFVQSFALNSIVHDMTPRWPPNQR